MGAKVGTAASTAIEGGQIVIHRPLGRTLDELATLAEATSQGAVPRQHILQAYPTVFSGWATVTFALDKDQEYILDLYDLNGIRRREIGKGRAQGGRLYEQSFNGNGLAEGLYFLWLVTDGGIQTVKLVLRR